MLRHGLDRWPSPCRSSRAPRRALKPLPVAFVLAVLLWPCAPGTGAPLALHAARGSDATAHALHLHPATPLRRSGVELGGAWDIPQRVARLRGGSELRDADGIAVEGFGGVWGGPVLWREGYYDPKDDREHGWELGSNCHGACVDWCDHKDPELTRAADEEERAMFADESTDSDDEKASLQPATSDRFPLVGEFGGLFEAFEAATAKWPQAVQVHPSVCT
jgi:hypothetical protein